jgi:Tfp pilus assembly protein PilZ
MQAREQRRDPRFRCRIPVELYRGRVALPSGVLLYMRPQGEVVETVTHLLTEDVSVSGMFLRTDAPPQLRQVVRVALMIPSVNVPMNVMAQVAHVVHPGDPHGRVPGAGILFFPLEGQMFGAWSAFVWTLSELRNDTIPAPPMIQESPAVLEPIRRRAERHPTSLVVHVNANGQPHLLRLHDISRNGVFITTDIEFPIGTQLLVRFVDPDESEEFAIEAVVRRYSAGAVCGVGVEFVGLDGKVREAFFRFLANAYRDVDLVARVLAASG